MTLSANGAVVVVVALLVFAMVAGLTQPTQAYGPGNWSTECAPSVGLTSDQCKTLIQKCNALALPQEMEWVGLGCTKKTSRGLVRRLDGGCQCKYYCGFRCRKKCANFRDGNGVRRCTWIAGKGCRNLDGHDGSPKAVCPHITASPTRSPTVPTASPTKSPTSSAPTYAPSNQPTSLSPTVAPTKSPTVAPTFAPSRSPTTLSPTSPTNAPTFRSCTTFTTIRACCGLAYANGHSKVCYNGQVQTPPGCRWRKSVNRCVTAGG